MKNLKDALFYVADKAREGKLGTVVLRLDSGFSLKVASGSLTAILDTQLVNDTQLKEVCANEKLPKVILANSSNIAKEDYTFTEFRKLALEQNAGLVYLECLSNLKNEEFSGGEVIICRTEKVISAGELIKELDNPEIQDNIIVYHNGLEGVYFACPQCIHPRVRSNDLFMYTELEGDKFAEAYTVKEYVNYLKQLDERTLLTLSNDAIPVKVEGYDDNVTVIETIKASGEDEEGLTGIYLREYRKRQKSSTPKEA